MKTKTVITVFLVAFILASCAPVVTTATESVVPMSTFAPVSPTPTSIPIPAVLYPIDNIHEVAVRPGGNELYAISMHTSSLLIVDIGSPNYPILGEIVLPGEEVMNFPYIVFSNDGAYAYTARRHNPEYIESWGLKDDNYIVVIDCSNRRIDYIIPMQPYMLDSSVVPSHDNKWLYFTGFQPGGEHGMGKLDLTTQKVVSFLPFGDYIYPPYITLSSNGRYIYAAQGDLPSGSEKNLFMVIDAENFEIVSSIEVGKGPWYVAVTPDGHKAYISNQWSNDVTVVNLETMKIIATIMVGPQPRSIAITPDGSKAYVALPGQAAVLSGGPTSLGGNSVAVIDIKRDVLLGTVKVDFDPETVSIDPDGTKAYVGDGGANGPNDPAEVIVIDTSNDKLLNPIILRKGSKYAPAGIDVTPDNSKLFITSMPRESIIAIDISTGKIINELKIEPRAVKVSADGSKVYVFSPVSESREARLLVIDSNSMTIVRTINLGKTGCLCVGPIAVYKIILNQTETIAYINYETLQKGLSSYTDPDDTGLVAVDLVNEGVIARIFYSERPDMNVKGMAITPDETTLLVSDPFSQSVVVIDTSTNKVIDRISVGSNPSAIKLSGDGKRAYVLQQLGNTQMTVIDVKTHKVLTNMDKYMYGVHARLDFEISANERYAYISNFDTNILSFYDLQERRVVKIIDTGLDPVQMASTPDMHYLYVNAVTSDEIYVVDTTSNSLIKIIKLGDP